MPKKVDGTDNVYVLGTQGQSEIIPARTDEEVQNMLEASLRIQNQQIDDFLGDLARLADRPDSYNYGSLMQHLQSECVIHLSALAAAAMLRIRDLKAQLDDIDDALTECRDKVRDMDEELKYWSNR